MVMHIGTYTKHTYKHTKIGCCARTDLSDKALRLLTSEHLNVIQTLDKRHRNGRV